MSERVVIAGNLKLTQPDLQDDAAQIQTSEGLIDRAKLSIKESTQRHQNSVTFVVEWYLGEKLVRRDSHVNKL